MGRDSESVVGGGLAGERGGLLLLLGRRAEVGGDADVVVLLLLHGAVVGGLGEAEVVVRHPLAAERAGLGSGGDRPGEAALVELAARAVGAVEVGADQIWSKALLEWTR